MAFLSQLNVSAKQCLSCQVCFWAIITHVCCITLHVAQGHAINYLSHVLICLFDHAIFPNSRDSQNITRDFQRSGARTINDICHFYLRLRSGRIILSYGRWRRNSSLNFSFYLQSFLINKNGYLISINKTNFYVLII